MNKLSVEYFKAKRTYSYVGIGMIYLLLSTWLFMALRQDAHLEAEEFIYTSFMISGFFLPIAMSVLCSRLTSHEHAGSTFSLLKSSGLTIGQIYRWKVLYAHLIASVMNGLFLIGCIMFSLSKGVALSSAYWLYFWCAIELVSGVFIVIYMSLSFYFSNQMIVLGSGLLGTFVGLMSFNIPSNMQLFIPWAMLQGLMPMKMSHLEELFNVEVTDLNWLNIIIVAGVYIIVGVVLHQVMMKGDDNEIFI
ncbi:hypothetical protein [Dolosigranulum pigrum]|uniref:hypothetical protein n=1 Tax=Dolosigranulum pigrum TaxID=29394 RepID=UPI0019186211|nr:hypothetical protein [Dolosigranulum pigrum]